MKKFSHGFTLAEILITMGIIGVLAAILIPMLIGILPDRDEKMHEKATQMLQDMVAQMANDEIMYPKNREYSKQGFKNIDPVKLEGLGNESHTYQGETKFCELFAHKFTRVYSEINCTNNTDDHITRIFKNVPLRKLKSDGTSEILKKDLTLVRTLKSGDDIDWYIPVGDFQTTEIGNSDVVGSGYSIIIADVNTFDRGDNCFPEELNRTDIPNRNGSGTHTCKKPDTFLYYVRSNGTVTENVPTVGEGKPYSITIQRACVEAPTAGNPDSCHSGISIYNEDGVTPVSGVTYSNGIFTGLESNKTYILKTTPINDFYSNWSWKAEQKNSDGTPKLDGDGKPIYEIKKNQRAIRLTGYDINTVVKVRYNKQSKLCLELRINDCEQNISECVTASIKKYKSGAYIGQKNEDGQEILPDNDKLELVSTTSDNDNKILKACNLQPGDYLIEAQGKTNGDCKYLALPITTTLDEYNNEVLVGANIRQPIKVGSENVTFSVTVAKQGDCSP